MHCASSSHCLHALVFRGQREVALADGIGHLVPVMRARYGDKIRFNVLKARRPLIRRLGLPGAAEVLGEALAGAEEHLLWSRFGLQAPR